MSTNPGLRKAFALLSTCVLAACLLLVGGGCGDSVECVVDTDCELGNRCEAQACVLLSTLPGRDTGPSQDAAAAEDANDSDDAGSVDDAGADDAGS